MTAEQKIIRAKVGLLELATVGDCLGSAPYVQSLKPGCTRTHARESGRRVGCAIADRLRPCGHHREVRYGLCSGFDAAFVNCRFSCSAYFSCPWTADRKAKCYHSHDDTQVVGQLRHDLSSSVGAFQHQINHVSFRASKAGRDFFDALQLRDKARLTSIMFHLSQEWIFQSARSALRF
jgi:hypothetical protein